MSLKPISELFNFEKGVLQSSKCIPGEFTFVTASAEWKTHSEYTHDSEALIFAAAASGSLGRTHYINGKFISSDLCFILTEKDPDNFPVDLKFYHIIFNELKDEIVRNTKAGTSKEAIGLGVFGKYKLPYFEIEKQRKIKSKFGELEELADSITTELTHQQTLVKQLRQQLLQEAVQGKLSTDQPIHAESDLAKQYGKLWNASGAELLAHIRTEKAKLIKEKKIKADKPLPPITEEEMPFELPEGWAWARLGEVVYNHDGARNPISQADRERREKIYDYYGASGAIDQIDGFTHEGDFLLIGEDGANLIARSTPIAFLVSGRFWVNNHAHVLAAFSSTFLEFLCRCLNALDIKSFISGGFQPKLSQGNLNMIPLPLPPLQTQHRIVALLAAYQGLCAALEAQIQESLTLNGALLQEVLREALSEK